MKVSERPADIKNRMDLFYGYMDVNNYQEADKILTEIEQLSERQIQRLRLQGHHWIWRECKKKFADIK